MALALEARLALVLRLLGRRQPARRGVRVEVDGRRENVGAVRVVVVVGVLGADGELALEDGARALLDLCQEDWICAFFQRRNTGGDLEWCPKGIIRGALLCERGPALSSYGLEIRTED